MKSVLPVDDDNTVNPSLRERAMNLGAAAFLKKPFDATTLADAIESALSPGDNWLPRAIGQ
jgi:DNA-binding NarL/FixJ family response regulator